MRFVDTNIFLRFLTRNEKEVDQTKAAACLELFRRVQRGEEEITTSETVVAEVVYVLSSPRHYQLLPDEISARLRPLVRLPGLKLPQKGRYLRALDLYSTYPFLDFEDALTVTYVQQWGDDTLYSYDTDFDRIPGIMRREP